MKLLTAILLAGMAGCAAWGQQTCTPVMGGYTGNDGIVWQTLEECKNPVSLGYLPAKPLKCGKYQHVEQVPDCAVSGDAVVCTNGTQPGSVAMWTNATHPECFPDMHSVTEKEWVFLLERLKRLEDAQAKR